MMTKHVVEQKFQGPHSMECMVPQRKHKVPCQLLGSLISSSNPKKSTAVKRDLPH